MAIDLRGFVRALLRQYAAEDFTEVDGDTLDDLLVAHGLAEWRGVMWADCQEPWAYRRGLEWGVGMSFCFLTDETKKLLD